MILAVLFSLGCQHLFQGSDLEDPPLNSLDPIEEIVFATEGPDEELEPQPLTDADPDEIETSSDDIPEVTVEESVPESEAPPTPIAGKFQRLTQTCEARTGPELDASASITVQAGRKIWTEPVDSYWVRIFKRAGVAFLSADCFRPQTGLEDDSPHDVTPNPNPPQPQQQEVSSDVKPTEPPEAPSQEDAAGDPTETTATAQAEDVEPPPPPPPPPVTVPDPVLARDLDMNLEIPILGFGLLIAAFLLHFQFKNRRRRSLDFTTTQTQTEVTTPNW
ncbi:MAG: hypothetical protein AB7F86_14275 [Bdellovibrionales bacterium]